jgi:hypothetical protein
MSHYIYSEDTNLVKKEKNFILSYLKKFIKKKAYKFLLQFNYNATQKNRILNYFVSKKESFIKKVKKK